MLWRCSVQFGVGFVSAEGFPTKASPLPAWPKLLQDHPNDHFYLSSPSSTVGSATPDSARAWRGKLQCFKATFFSFMCESPICVAWFTFLYIKVLPVTQVKLKMTSFMLLLFPLPSEQEYRNHMGQSHSCSTTNTFKGSWGLSSNSQIYGSENWESVK